MPFSFPIPLHKHRVTCRNKYSDHTWNKLAYIKPSKKKNIPFQSHLLQAPLGGPHPQKNAYIPAHTIFPNMGVFWSVSSSESGNRSHFTNR